MKHLLIFVLAALLAQSAPASEPAVTFSARPTVSQADGRVIVAFSVSAPTDVEVAILDADGVVVRHLAAGVLGRKTPPPPPLKAGLAQTLEWDGKDDLGQAAKGGPFKVRVRAGMGARLDRIVGGDPYAYYSLEMDRGNHSGWIMSGLEAKSDGTVYVLGKANVYGPPALRAYDAAGDYKRTVFPPPANKPADAMKGWGLNVFADGSWSPQFTTTDSPGITRTILQGDRIGGMPGLQPTADPDKLLVRMGLAAMEVGIDGACASASPKPFVTVPIPEGKSAIGTEKWLNGGYYSCPAPGNDKFYISGVFEMSSWQSHNRFEISKDGPWRDGQVYGVDRKTGKATVFYAISPNELPADQAARYKSPIGGSPYAPYGALQGVAVDGDGRVFVCDRLRKQIIVLDKDAKAVRTIPMANADAIAVDPGSRAIYVTTRHGSYHDRGRLALVRFNDWTKDEQPSQTIELCDAGAFGHQSHLATAARDGKTFVWVAYTELPVRVYRETGTALELHKDFYQAATQRCLDLERIAADPKTEAVYAADSFRSLFRLTDWNRPRLDRCYQSEGVPVQAASVAIDWRRRHVYGRHQARGPGWAGPVRRYHMDGEFLTPAGVGEGGDNNITGDVLSPDWMINWGNGDRGFAIAPDGNLATLDGQWVGGKDGGGKLQWFTRSEQKTPWPATELGVAGELGGIRFDPAGNMYIGMGGGRRGGDRTDVPAPFDKDKTYQQTLGRIVKYAPTGSLESGNLYPKPVGEPARTYDAPLGPFGRRFRRTPRFGVDGYGRIYYPDGLAQKVGVIDNEGNEILRFGAYGNRDSAGGLEGDLAPTHGIPLACPNSVDATEDYIYVGDTVNIRLLRIAKTFAASETVPLK